MSGNSNVIYIHGIFTSLGTFLAYIFPYVFAVLFEWNLFFLLQDLDLLDLGEFKYGGANYNVVQIS